MNTYIIKLDVVGAVVTGVVKAPTAEDAKRSLGNRPLTFGDESWAEWQVRNAYVTRKRQHTASASTTFHAIEVSRGG